jgi:NitT/TauT family transport system substrate-binding protein
MRSWHSTVNVGACLLIGALGAGCASSAESGRPAPAVNTPPGPQDGARVVAAPPTMVRLFVAYGNVSANQLPLWVTHEQGLFAKYGIDAELSYIEGSVGVRALTTGDAPISSVGRAIVPSKLSGADVAIVAQLSGVIPYSLYAAPEVATVGDLRGRTIVTTSPGSTNYQGVTLLLKQYGWEAGNDVQVLTSPGNAEQLAVLRQGLAHAALFSPPATIRAREQGLHEVLNLSDTGIPFVSTVIGVNRPFAAQSPEVVWNFLRALSEGLRVTEQDPTAAKAALAKYTRLDDPAALDETYVFNSGAWPKEPPYPNLAAVQTILDLQNTREASAARPEDFVDRRYVQELDDQGFFQRIGLVP